MICDIRKRMPLSRRDFLALTGTAIGSSFLPGCISNTTTHSKLTPPSFTLFYKPEHTGNIWDTWIYYHQGTFYLYYNPSPRELKTFGGGWNSVALATSRDGVHWKEYGTVINETPDIIWLGAGAVWTAGKKFIMNFSELRKTPEGTEQAIFFAESDDLIHWRRLGPAKSFDTDTRWYEPDGRWDNIWPIPRPEGGYYGYWAAAPKNKQVGVGFGESDDGITWRALAPALLEDVPLGPPGLPTPEVSGAYSRQEKHYLLVVLNDLDPIPSEDLSELRQGITTLVRDSVNEPFRPAPKNRRLLVCNASYFMRFVDVGNDVLVNHHSWEVDPNMRWGINPDRVYMAPIKRAQWDDEGTLRLMWWEQNNLAKSKSLPVSVEKNSLDSRPTFLSMEFDPLETLILEGEISLPETKDATPTGLYLQGSGKKGTAFVVRENGAVDYGGMPIDGIEFDIQGHVDRELSFKGPLRFRLVRKGQITEFYLNDYLMQCYSLPEQGTGRIGFIGLSHQLDKLKAWYCG